MQMKEEGLQLLRGWVCGGAEPVLRPAQGAAHTVMGWPGIWQRIL